MPKLKFYKKKVISSNVIFLTDRYDKKMPKFHNF